MDHQQIKTALSKNGYSVRLLAKAMNVSYSAVGGVIKRTITSKRIAEGICSALELPIDKVFPDRKEYYESFNPEEREEVKVEQLRKKIEATTPKSISA